MAAPEYLIKLKFGTDVDKKAFNEIQEAYNNLNKKQQATFAKQYGSSVQEMNKIFQKEMKSNLKEYENAAIKTERTLTSARIRELREFINKRNQQMKRFPGFMAGAVGTAGVATARAAIQSSTGLTQYDKNFASSALTAGTGGATAGFFVAGPLGALVGGAVGTASALLMTEFENSSDAIKRSAQLFSDAVTTYRATLDFTKGMASGMAGAGFTDVGEYQVYKQALKNVGIENDSFMNDLARSLASQKETATLGATLINMRRDEGLQMLYERYKASGMTAREFVMSSTDKGGLNQSDFRADALIALFEKGGLNQAIQDVLKYVVQKGESASKLSAPLEAANKKRMDLENREWASAIQNIQTIADIDMNDAIMEEAGRSFNRSVTLMRESNIILAGINESYKMYEKELKQIFGYITGKTGVGTSYAEKYNTKLTKALRTGDNEDLFDALAAGSTEMSYAKPMMSKIDKASDRISRTRSENRPMSINSF